MTGNYDSLVEEAYNLHTKGEFRKAQILYEKLINEHPDDLKILVLYAELVFSLKEYDKSLEIFKKIYDKTHIEDFKINIARIYLIKKRFCTFH